MRGFGIGELSARAKVPVANIRYYEEIGILPKAGRLNNGHQAYGENDLARLRFVKNCRELDFPIKQIRTLLHLSILKDRSCSEVRDLADEQLSMVRRKLVELKALERQLEQQVVDCDVTCCNGPAPDCSVFKSLSN